MNKALQARELSHEEMANRLEESKKELFNLRFQLATGRLDNISRITTVRRDIARLHTLMGENERAAAGSTGKEE